VLIQRLLIILALSASGAALAQTYPAKPVRVVVPFPPGGGTDIVARTVTPKMAEILGQPFVIENRAGAGGNIGTDLVAKSPADGYTLLVASASTAINTTLVPNLSWAFPRDFAPVVLMVVNNHLLAAHPSVPANNVRELLALARAKPGQVTYASYGSGSSAHLTAELFKLMAGVDLLHVPYKGAAPAVNDLLGGQVNIIFADVAAMLSLLRPGSSSRSASARRSASRPARCADHRRVRRAASRPAASSAWCPRRHAAGHPGAERRRAKTWRCPRCAIACWASPAPVGGTPEQFASHIQREIDKWARVIRAANIKLGIATRCAACSPRRCGRTRRPT
jgi:tripartite-type tricarboxylate transporter receptor subunit TctC